MIKFHRIRVIFNTSKIVITVYTNQAYKIYINLMLSACCIRFGSESGDLETTVLSKIQLRIQEVAICNSHNSDSATVLPTVARRFGTSHFSYSKNLSPFSLISLHHSSPIVPAHPSVPFRILSCGSISKKKMASNITKRKRVFVTTDISSGICFIYLLHFVYSFRIS